MTAKYSKVVAERIIKILPIINDIFSLVYLKKFLETNEYDKNFFHQLVTKTDNIPDRMENYVNRFYARQ